MLANFDIIKSHTTIYKHDNSHQVNRNNAYNRKSLSWQLNGRNIAQILARK